MTPSRHLVESVFSLCVSPPPPPPLWPPLHPRDFIFVHNCPISPDLLPLCLIHSVSFPPGSFLCHFFLISSHFNFLFLTHIFLPSCSFFFLYQTLLCLISAVLPVFISSLTRLFPSEMWGLHKPKIRFYPPLQSDVSSSALRLHGNITLLFSAHLGCFRWRQRVKNHEIFTENSYSFWARVFKGLLSSLSNSCRIRRSCGQPSPSELRFSWMQPCQWGGAT